MEHERRLVAEAKLKEAEDPPPPPDIIVDDEGAEEVEYEVEQILKASYRRKKLHFTSSGKVTTTPKIPGNLTT